MSRQIYLASSWRNSYQPSAAATLRSFGHAVYDFRNPSAEGPPATGAAGFGWQQIDRGWQGWTTTQYLKALNHPMAEQGFTADWEAMRWADTFVLLMPCGRSAHLEAGWAIGAGKPTAIWLDDDPAEPAEPELMYKMADLITEQSMQVMRWLDQL